MHQRLVLRMKRIGTLGYIILGLITTSAFAETTSTPTTAPATESTQTASSGKHKKGGKKHSHHAHKKKQAPAAEQK